MRRNQDGGLLRKSFLEHLRILERRLLAKKKYLLPGNLAAQQKRLLRAYNSTLIVDLTLCKLTAKRIIDELTGKRRQSVV